MHLFSFLQKSGKKDHTEDVIEGGKREQFESHASTSIESTDITFFDLVCSFSSCDNAEVEEISAYAVPVSEGIFAAFKRNKDAEPEFFVSKFPALKEINDIIVKYDCVKNNGISSFTNGLPENFGGSLSVDYSSGEYIRKSDNQSPIVSPEAGKAFYDLFLEMLKKPFKQSFVPDDISVICYDETDQAGDGCHIELKNEKGNWHIYSTRKFASSGNEFEHDNSVSKDDVRSFVNSAVKSCMFYWNELPIQNFEIYKSRCKAFSFTLQDGKIIEAKEATRLPSFCRSEFFKLAKTFEGLVITK